MVRLVFENAKLYNSHEEGQPGTVYDAAVRLRDLFDTEFAVSLRAIETSSPGDAYSPRPSKSKSKPKSKSKKRDRDGATKGDLSPAESETCKQILGKLQEIDKNAIFATPVDTKALEDYTHKIKQKRDLGTVKVITICCPLDYA